MGNKDVDTVRIRKAGSQGTGRKVFCTSLAIVLVCMLAACGGSPTEPSSQTPHEIELTRMTVDTSGHFAGFGPSYSVCGIISPAKGVTEDIVLHDLTVHIRDAAGRTFLTWSIPSFSGRLGLGIGGCFGSHSDPVEGRAPGATFHLRLTYSRVTGPSRLIEVSGPVETRRLP